MQLQYRQKANGMYYLSTTDFDTISEMVLKEYIPKNLQTPQPLPIDYLAQECLFMEIKPAFLTVDRSIYGATVFEDGEMPCYDHLFQPSKMIVQEGNMIPERQLCSPETHHLMRFTKAHEASHWICHRSYHDQSSRPFEFRREKPVYIACRQGNIQRYEKNAGKKRTDDEWEEWQADHLAAALLMPRCVL